MLVGVQLLGRHDALHGLTLEHLGVITQIVKEFRFADEKARVDPGTALIGFLLEGKHGIIVIVNLQDTQFAARLVGHHGEHLTRFFVRFDGVQDVHIGKTVAVVEQEGLVADVFLHAVDAAASHGVQTGINHRHLPVFGVVVQYFQTVVGEVHRDVAIVHKVVRKILFDDILLISAADDKLIETELVIVFHDMPQDRFPPDFNHRFRNQIGGFTESGAKTSR